MYREKKDRLREQEIERTVRQYMFWRRKMKDPDGDYAYIKNLPYNELPCAEEASLREYVEERLSELEKEQVSYLIKHNAIIQAKQWPRNLYETVFAGQTISLSDSAEKALIAVIHTLPPIDEQCVLKFYQERKPWDEVCDELDIYVVELNERICKSLRKLRHPSRSRELAKCIVLSEHNTPHKPRVLSDELKKAVLQLVKEGGIPQELVTLPFLQKRFKVGYLLALELKKYLTATL